MSDTFTATDREFLLFASYCGDDNPDCSDERPCPVCLGMSNIYRLLPNGDMAYVRQMSPDWNTDLAYSITPGGAA